MEGIFYHVFSSSQDSEKLFQKKIYRLLLNIMSVRKDSLKKVVSREFDNIKKCLLSNLSTASAPAKGVRSKIFNCNR